MAPRLPSHTWRLFRSLSSSSSPSPLPRGVSSSPSLSRSLAGSGNFREGFGSCNFRTNGSVLEENQFPPRPDFTVLRSRGLPYSGYHISNSNFQQQGIVSSCFTGFPVSGHVAMFHSTRRTDDSLQNDEVESASSSSEDLLDWATSATETLTDVAITTGSEVAGIADKHWLPTVILQQAIEAMHLGFNLPWWASIAATTVCIRLTLLPLMIHQMKLMDGLAKVKPEVEKMLARVKESGYDPQVVDRYQKETAMLYRKHNTNPFAPVVGALIQGTTFVYFFFAVDGMAKGLESFKTGGALWFVDLTTPDTLYIFPLLAASSFLITVELNAVEGLESNPQAAQMKMFMRFLAVAMIPLTMGFPKAMFCYWLTANVFSLAQSSVLRVPKVREILNLPPRVPIGAQLTQTVPSFSTKKTFQPKEVSQSTKFFAQPPIRAQKSGNKGRDGKLDS